MFTSAREAWVQGSQMRAARRRFKNFTYGRQWDDPVRDPDGSITTEGERASRAGRRPITNNLLRSLVKSVVGRFRYNLTTEERAPATEHLRTLNQLDELDARALEEFLISGCAIQRVVYEKRFEGTDVWVDNVSPAMFFCNRFLDPRGSDLRLVGQLHDMSLPEMKMRFGHRNRRRCRELEQLYSRSRSMCPALSLATLGSGDTAAEPSFDAPADPRLCRVIEVWSFETHPSRGSQWHCRYYGPDGTLIDETASPFAHGSHPYAVKFYPLTDGEVHPFIEDVVDQQRHINLLITTIDHILAHSAKGALLFPTDALPPGHSIEDAARLWGAPGAVIPVNSRAARMPQEVTSPGASQGASTLLDLELRLFQQISGVTSALQGQDIGGRVSASLYDSQAGNAAIALMDVYATFDSFRKARDAKAIAVINKLSH